MPASLAEITPLQFVPVLSIEKVHCMRMNDWSTGLFHCCRVPEGIPGADGW
jgi:hypothetical protein